MDVYLRAKFEVSNIILTSFRQEVILPPPPPPPPTSKRTCKKPTQIMVNILNGKQRKSLHQVGVGVGWGEWRLFDRDVYKNIKNLGWCSFDWGF